MSFELAKMRDTIEGLNKEQQIQIVVCVWCGVGCVLRTAYHDLSAFCCSRASANPPTQSASES